MSDMICHKCGEKKYFTNEEPSLSDVERLREALSLMGIAYPESLEECSARYGYLVSCLVSAVIGSKLARQWEAIRDRRTAAIMVVRAGGYISEGAALALLGIDKSELREMARALADDVYAEFDEWRKENTPKF